MKPPWASMILVALALARLPDGAKSAIFSSLIATSNAATSLAVTQRPLVMTRSNDSMAMTGGCNSSVVLSLVQREIALFELS